MKDSVPHKDGLGGEQLKGMVTFRPNTYWQLLLFLAFSVMLANTKKLLILALIVPDRQGDIT